MIIENGYMQVVEQSGGGMQNGRPIPVVETLQSAIPCNIKTIKHDRKGVTVDSVYTQSSYEVLVDIANIHHFTADKIALTDNRQMAIGVYKVQDVQHLDYVEAIKIIV